MKKPNLADKPLTTWYCDICGDLIINTASATVIYSEKNNKASNFKITHKTCIATNNYDNLLRIELNDLLGEDGLALLLSMLSLGPIKKHIGQPPYCDVANTDMDSFVDLIRRVQTPYYEQARRVFGKQNLLDDYADVNEVQPYTPEELQKIINHY